MLDENSVYYADNVDDDPRALLETRKPAVRHHIFARRSNRSVLVLERLRKRRDQITQALSARRNVRAVLEVVWRPITIVGSGIPPIKRCLERLEDQRFVLLFDGNVYRKSTDRSTTTGLLAGFRGKSIFSADYHQ
jgi:hypothetical protein